MDYLDQMNSLRSQGQPFVLATVVRVEKPTSAKPGAKAIVTQDGNLMGWIGGSCAEPSVKKEAARALADGQIRLLRLCPPEKLGLEPQEGVTELNLTCMSGGTLEIYLEPHIPPPHLLVVGHQAAAQALVALGKIMEYRVSAAGEVTQEQFSAADRLISGLNFSEIDVTPNTYVVVASHGNYDEAALEAFLPSKAAYVALVTSKKRAESVRTYLQEAGLNPEQIARLKFPAGLDIGGATPPEIALSILAEIIQFRSKGLPSLKAAQPVLHEEKKIETAVDPVCGMTVEVATARYSSLHEGKTIYFCSAHCQHKFEKNPEMFLEPKGVGR